MDALQLDPASRWRVGLFVLMPALLAAGAAIPASLGGAVPATLALLARQRIGPGLGLWDEAAAFGMLGSLAHPGLRWLAEP